MEEEERSLRQAGRRRIRLIADFPKRFSFLGLIIHHPHYLMWIHRFDLSLFFFFFQFFFLFPSTISAIRTNIGLAVNSSCRSTVQGRYLLTDDNGYVCDALSVDPLSHCCPGKGEKFPLAAILFHNVAIRTNIVFHAARILQGQKGIKY